MKLSLFSSLLILIIGLNLPAKEVNPESKAATARADIVGTIATNKGIKIRKPAAANFKVHQCEAEAVAHANRLIRLHFMEDSNSNGIENLYVDEQVTMKAPMKTPVGKGMLDVLEVNASIYKANYRMRFIYAQIKDTCALMGQEILELSNPY